MALGRWRSEAVERYLRNAPVRSVFTVARDAAAGLRGHQAPSHAPASAGVPAAGAWEELRELVAGLLAQFEAWQKPAGKDPPAERAADRGREGREG
eukprot:6917045-Lingulodinium_polyedra.AAC.1